MKVRLVLDTSVLVAALRSRLGASNKVLRKVARRETVLLLSPALLLEYEEVLKRPEHRLVHGLTEESVDALVSELAALAEPVEMYFSWRPLSADPGDEMVLETAVNGAAEVLITLNVRDFSAAERFKIRVMRPGEFLRSRLNE